MAGLSSLGAKLAKLEKHKAIKKPYVSVVYYDDNGIIPFEGEPNPTGVLLIPKPSESVEEWEAKNRAYYEAQELADSTTAKN